MANITTIYNLEANVGEFISNLSRANAENHEFVKSVDSVKDKVKAMAANINKVSFTRIGTEAIDIRKKLDVAFGSGLDISAINKSFNDLLGDAKKLREFLGGLKSGIIGLDESSEDFRILSNAIETTENALRDLDRATDANVKNGGSLRTQIKNIREEMRRLEDAGQDNTEQYHALANQAGRFTDQMGDLQGRIRILSSDTKNIDFGVEAIQTATAAFEVGAGAAALFGVEEEKLQEVQTKLIALMAVANGLQQIKVALLKESTLRVVGHDIATKLLAASTALYNKSVLASVVSLKTFRGALLATGIGAIVVAIGLLVANWDDLTGAIEGANKEQALNNKLIDEAADSYGKAVVAIKKMETASKLFKDGTLSKTDALKVYNEELKDLGIEFTNVDDAERFMIANAPLFIQAQMAKAKATAAAALAQEAFANQLRAENKAQQPIGVFEQMASMFNSFDDFFSLESLEKTAKKVRQRTIDAAKKDGDFYASMAAKSTEDFTKIQLQLENQAVKFGAKRVKADKKVNDNIQKQRSENAKKLIDPYEIDIKAIEDKYKEQEILMINAEKDLALIGEQSRYAKEVAEKNHAIKLIALEIQKQQEILAVQKKFNKSTLDTRVTIAKLELDKVKVEIKEIEPEKIDTIEVKAGVIVKPEAVAIDSGAVAEALNEAEERQRERRDKERQDAISAAQETADAIYSIVQDSYNKRNALLDTEIDIQRSRYDRALKLAENGNSKYLEIEEQRLNELETKRTENARAQIAIDTALRSSAILTALAQALADPNGSKFTKVAAIVTALASGAALVNSLNSQVPRLYDGTDYLYSSRAPKGKDKYPAFLHEGERVVPSYINKELVAMGIKNADLPRLVKQGLVLDTTGAKNIKYDVQTLSTKALESKIDNLTSVVAGIRLEANLSKGKISTMVSNELNRTQRRKNV